DRGASPDARSGKGNTPLMLAASRSHLDVVRVLLASEADVNLRNDRRGTALIFAVESRSPEIVRALLAAGAKKRYRDREGQSAISLAERLGAQEIHEILQERPAARGGLLGIF
ncbi:MAG: ankyrin repeat domain-containing protein, partial [Myxococcota bacterium]